MGLYNIICLIQEKKIPSGKTEEIKQGNDPIENENWSRVEVLIGGCQSDLMAKIMERNDDVVSVFKDTFVRDKRARTVS